MCLHDTFEAIAATDLDYCKQGQSAALGTVVRNSVAAECCVFGRVHQGITFGPIAATDLSYCK